MTRPREPGGRAPDPMASGDPGAPRAPADGREIPSGRIMPGEHRLEPPRWEQGRTGPPHGEFSTIGRRNRKIEGLAKVTGRAIYADDISLPRMLHGKLKRSPHARARILAIDASAALAIP